jgi:hypothetical protein
MFRRAYQVEEIQSDMVPGYRVIRIADGEVMGRYNRYEEQQAKARCFALQAAYELSTDARIPIVRGAR